MHSWVRHISKAEDRPGTLRARAVLIFAAAILLLVFQGCAAVGPAQGSTPPASPPIPAIGGPQPSRSESQRGTRLLRATGDSLASGAYEWVTEAANTVIRDFPGLPGSGEAYLLLAKAELSLGDAGSAAQAAGTYASLLGPSHPGFPQATLLHARALNGAGEGSEAALALFSIPGSAPDSLLKEGADLLRELAPLLPTGELADLTEGLPANSPYLGMMATHLATALYLRGEFDEATPWARRALSTALEAQDSVLASGVLEERLEEVLGRPIIVGVVVPRSGVSPNRLQYGEWIYEGVQVALEEFKSRIHRPIQLELVDDRGSPLGARTAVRSLNGFGAMGAIGFLSQDVLEEAANTRDGAFPLVSPFAFLPGTESPAVFSLSGPDPGGARVLARAAEDLELATVAIVRPATEEARAEAESFRQDFLALGGMVPPDIVFDSGATFFQPQFQQVEDLLPDGLFLPLTPRDIQLLAPQITFYGVDTLGAQILGTSGWTEDEVVLGVDSRHTDGVVAATTRLTQDDSEAFLRFKATYESFFSKTLRSQVPAFGYDAAALIFQAMEAGPRNPYELVAAMAEIRDFPGATGVLSVVDGGIRREPLLVRIQDQELIYITRRFK